MIKFKNILFESSVDNELDNKINRKYLYLIDRHIPDIREKTDIYLNHYNNQSYDKQLFYRDMRSFLENDSMLASSEVNILLFLWLLNYKVNNFLTDKLNLGEDLFLCTVEYTGEDVNYDTSEEWEDCSDCEGSGVETRECQFCSGSGEIEDPDSEEGDTLVCDDCDGSGEVVKFCNSCGGEGGYPVEEEYSHQSVYYDVYILTNKISDDIYDYNSFSELLGIVEPLIYCKMYSKKYERDSRVDNMGAEDELEDLYIYNITPSNIKYGNILG